MSDKVIIGRGGFGEVYYYKDRPGVAYKETHSKCDDLKREYTTWSKAYNAFIRYSSSQKSMRKRVCILHPSDWKRSPKNRGRCIFKMGRVVPLDFGKPKSTKYTWQAYIGNEDEPHMDRVVKVGDKIRGRYMGPKTLEKYFDVSELANDAGILIGIVHYCAKLDGTDTELIVGKLYSAKGVSQKCRLFLIDFDQVRPWDPKELPQKMSDIVKRLSWPLDAEPYWPDRESPYYDSFKKGYLKVAKKCGYEELAQKVLDRRY